MKAETIDCLLIGPNEMNFPEYEESVRKMGVHSGAFRDLSLNFIRYNNRPYHAMELFNLFCCGNGSTGKGIEPVTMGEVLSPAIAYLGTFLTKHGFTFDYINSFQERKEELERKLKKNNILTIAITTTLYISPFPIFEIMNFIKKHNRTVRVIVGGPFVATQIRVVDRETLEYLFESIGADFYVNSAQGEAALVNIIKALKGNLPLDQIDNIYYKTHKGYRFTPVLKENNILSENMVRWELFAERPIEYAAVRTSVSCPFSCAYCGFPEHAGKFQTASVEAIESEFNRLTKKNPVKCIHFTDDTFNVPLKRFKDILRMLIKNKYGFKWNSFYRCQYADRETVELMKESGCEGVFMGIESGSDKILKNMNKASRVEKYYEGIALLKEYDIVTHGSFIIGFPGETMETVNETLEFIEKSKIDFYRSQLWYFEAITPIGRQREKYNIEGSNFEWTHATMDTGTACDWIDKIFFRFDDPVRFPYYFDFFDIFRLKHRGLSMDQIKNFMRNFNNGVKEKLSNPSQEEAGCDVIAALKGSLMQDNAVTVEVEDSLEEEDIYVDLDLD